MLVSALCQLDVACCGLEMTILEAASLMRHKHVGDLVVVANDGDDRVPLGIITDRDIVVEVLGAGRDPRKITVGEVIRRPVVLVSEQDDAARALEQMQAHGVRRVPVVDHAGKLTGIITADDLLKSLAADANRLADTISREQTHEQRARR
jgi:CBS domain-containing protein